MLRRLQRLQRLPPLVWRPYRPLTAITPDRLSNLWAWYDAATLTTLFQDNAGTTPVTGNSDPVGYWADRSGNGRYVRQTGAVGTRPTYTTGVQNSLPGILYDGGDYLDSVATLDSFPLTIIGVARTSASVGAARGLVCFYHSTNFGSRVIFGSGNTVQALVATPSTTRNSVATFGANTTVVFGARFNTTESAAIANGVINSGAAAAAAVNNILSLGRSNVNTTSSLHNGYLCEVCIYSDAKSDADIAQLCSYLNTKWMVY